MHSIIPACTLLDVQTCWLDVECCIYSCVSVCVSIDLFTSYMLAHLFSVLLCHSICTLLSRHKQLITAGIDLICFVRFKASEEI